MITSTRCRCDHMQPLCFPYHAYSYNSVTVVRYFHLLFPSVAFVSQNPGCASGAAVVVSWWLSASHAKE